MYSHIMLGANNIEESKKFYDAVLGALGYPEGVIDEKGRVFWFTDSGIFSISIPIDGEPACAGNGSTVGFAVDSPEQGDAWHAAGLANGGVSIEEPRVLVKVPSVRCTWPTCAIPLAIKSAPCTVWGNHAL